MSAREEDPEVAFGVLDKAREAAVEVWPGYDAMAPTRRLVLNVFMQESLVAAFNAVRDDLVALIVVPPKRIDTCPDCSGSGLATQDGKAYGHCRMCKGLGRLECPRLGRLQCVRETPHDPQAVGGHQYETPTARDGHDRSEEEAERSRG